MRIPQEVLQKANATGESFISSTRPGDQSHTTLEVVLSFICLAVVIYSIGYIAEVSFKILKQINLKKLLRRILGMALILFLVKYETLGTFGFTGKNIGIDEIVNAMGALSLDVFIGAGLVSWVMM